MKNFSFFVFYILSFLIANAQNEFYIKGDNSSSTTEVYVKNAPSSMPTLYVKGSVTNNTGIFVNDAAKLEITTDFTNTADATNAYYSSTGEEKFTDYTASVITGNFDGLATVNNLNQLKVYKGTTSTYISLADNVNVKNLVDINSGIIRTATSSNSINGNLYSNILFLMNTNPTSLTSASSGNTNYIEGKLKRATDMGSSYFFPVGVAPTFLDGMEPFTISPTAGSGDVLGYLQATSQTYSNFIFHDIGRHPTGAFAFTPISGCIAGAPDNFLDAFGLTNDFDLDWNVTNPSGGSITQYDITVAPGTALDATTTYTNSCYGAAYKYMSRNGMPGGIATLVASGPSSVKTGPNPGQNLSAFNGLILAPTGYTLTAQPTFSLFKMHGPSSSGGALPVTYLYLTAKPIENSYIQLDWATASERDNSGFDIERSEDGINFKKIGFVNGSGTTTSATTYTQNDYQVVAGIHYYYRLKQIDYSGSYDYSNIVSAKLTGDVKESVAIYPNPNTESDQLKIDIVSGNASVASVKVYDVVGKLVMNEKMPISAGYNSSAISKTNLATGTYTVSVVLNEKVITQKLNVIR